MDSVAAPARSQNLAPADQTGSVALEKAIATTQAYLLEQQAAEGYWVAELESDVTVSAGYVALTRFMGIAQPERERKIVSFLRSQQMPDGGWSNYWGGPSNLNVSVQAYFALKLAGIQPEESFMQQARTFILSQGGVSKTHTFTKILIALFGQYDWQGLPSLPPELILLPNWFPFTIYEFASWARATIVDLMVILTEKPVCPIPESAGIFELYAEPRDEIEWSLPKPRKRLSWQGFFIFMDGLFKGWEALPFHPGRKRALQRALEWITVHQEADGSWGGIMLPWVYSLVALKAVGYPLDHPVITKGLSGLEGFIIEDESTFRLQPAVSPVWDTALSVIALCDSGLDCQHPALVKAARWLLGKQILRAGDWQIKNPHTEPGAWAFEFDNDLYPDVDDTAMVPLALMRVALPEEQAKREAISKALPWILSMQSRDGGWAAFDRDNDMQILAKIPYADFMTPLDPTSVDVTAHVIEFLAALDDRSGQAPCQQAVHYLRQRQEVDGSWFGRWGVNYVYGTGAALAALGEAGEDMEADYIQHAVRWLKAQQNEDGGWGESCSSYEDPAVRDQAASTPSQTAWSLLGLLASGEGDSHEVRKGIAHLLDTQLADGTWEEQLYTGTGFPRAFYLRYHFYRVYFPLMALARFKRWQARRESH